MPDTAHIFAARLPRYTSYPTAPHFHAGTDAATYGQWLAQVPLDEPLSLYFHIPFCDSLCWFCGCNTTVVRNYEPVRAYIDQMIAEIGLVARALGATRRPVAHIHWGGGSPSMLLPDDVERLTRAIRDAFSVAPDAEFAVEIDPRGFTAAQARTLAAAGVNRASIGIQDFEPKVQAAINRIQSEEETARVVTWLRDAGIANINFDLVYGLPYQTAQSIARNLSAVLALAPDRLAVFGYAHVPDFKKHQALIPRESLPDVTERLHQETLIHATLLAHGFEAIGLDHYARPRDSLARAAREGRLARNFQGYTTDKSSVLLGFGTSAIGRLRQGYVQNLSHTPQYGARIAAGALATARGVALSERDRAAAQVIERLMCDLTVDLRAVRERFGFGRCHFAAALKRLAPLVARHLVAIDGEQVTVTGQHRQSARMAAAAFDDYLDTAANRHAVTA